MMEHHATFAPQHMALMACQLAKQSDQLEKLSAEVREQAVTINKLRERSTLRLCWTTTKDYILRRLMKTEHIINSESTGFHGEHVYLQFWHNDEDDRLFLCAEVPDSQRFTNARYTVSTASGTVIVSDGVESEDDVDERDGGETDVFFDANGWLCLGSLEHFKQLTSRLSATDHLVIRWQGEWTYKLGHCPTDQWLSLRNEDNSLADGYDELMDRVATLEQESSTHKRRRCS